MYRAWYLKLFSRYIYECFFRGLGRELFQYSEYTSIHSGIKFVNQNRVQILLRQECLTACHFRSTSPISGPVQVWDVCPSICLSVCVTGCLFAVMSVCLSGFLYPDGLGTLPALCHMISLEAAGVKLIWSGLKAYKRLMLRINCSHLNSPFPPLKCPSCPCSAPDLLTLANGKRNWERNVT